jgi:DNA-binding MurR/RpiR family transcriptional regulator
MKNVNFPIALPADFLSEFKLAAHDAGVSTATAIRQSAKLGLPKFREQTATPRITNVDPLPNRVARKLYDQRQDDVESIRRFIAAQPKDAR